MINLTRKQAEDIIALVNKNTSISRGVVTNFLQTKLDEPVEKQPYVPQQNPNFCNSDRV